MKINSQRLEKYIHNREWQKSQHTLLDSISGMTKEQFKEIADMLKKNKNYQYPKYK